jgi:hypothetical protein
VLIDTSIGEIVYGRGVGDFGTKKQTDIGGSVRIAIEGSVRLNIALNSCYSSQIKRPVVL